MESLLHLLSSLGSAWEASFYSLSFSAHILTLSEFSFSLCVHFLSFCTSLDLLWVHVFSLSLHRCTSLGFLSPTLSTASPACSHVSALESLISFCYCILGMSHILSVLLHSGFPALSYFLTLMDVLCCSRFLTLCSASLSFLSSLFLSDATFSPLCIPADFFYLDSLTALSLCSLSLPLSGRLEDTLSYYLLSAISSFSWRESLFLDPASALVFTTAFSSRFHVSLFSYTCLSFSSLCLLFLEEFLESDSLIFGVLSA